MREREGMRREDQSSKKEKKERIRSNLKEGRIKVRKAGDKDRRNMVKEVRERKTGEEYIWERQRKNSEALKDNEMECRMERNR